MSRQATPYPWPLTALPAPEAFLAAALFGSMGAGDQLKLTPYQSAAEAAQAVAKGETNFAVSHQSQILETYQQGGVDVVCAFDDKAIDKRPLRRR